MILVPARGTIGKVMLAPKHFEQYVASENIITVTASDKLAGYLYSFLNSGYGEVLIKRETTGSVVDMIEENHVRQVKVPLLKNQNIQSQINEMVLEANQLRYEAYLLEQEAIQAVNKQVIFAEK
jgi:type I restriction enzyme S subunit